jgi:hypothetical protein
MTGSRSASVLLVLLAATSLSACAASSSAKGSLAHRGQRASGGTTTSTTTTTAATTTTTTDPGALPQTDQLPSSGTAQFAQEMDALWQGVVDDSVPTAMASFFPEQAYLKVKAIADPQADYENRLVAEFALDLGAAHALLGPDPSSARLVGVTVPSQYAHWVAPGTCYNGVGYYEVPNSRVVYQQAGATRSFGIASLISWRGVWYVVHLGAVVRSFDSGVVDDPATGPGTSAFSSTC